MSKKNDNHKSKSKSKLPKKLYEKKLLDLQVELCHLQEWVKESGAKIVVVFEGRDAAGKGGMIKRITARVSPRIFRVVALPKPTDREKTQFYYQRYIAQLPAAGEVVVFDRSWYNRAGVERVMGFCTKTEYKEFLRTCPGFEKALIDSGIILVKYWLQIDQETQKKRFMQRINDPTKNWKLSPMDIEAVQRWYDYSIARDDIFDATHTDLSPWHVVDARSKRSARLNCITHLLSLIPYKKSPHDYPKLPSYDKPEGYQAPDHSALEVPRIY